MIALNFHETFRYAFPEPSESTIDPVSAVAMTVGRRDNEPVLWFVTQGDADDVLVELHLLYDFELGRMPTPYGRHTIGGLGYHRRLDLLLAAQRTTGWNETFLIDPVSGAEVGSLDLSADSAFDQFTGAELDATATDGLIFAQAGLTGFGFDADGTFVHPSVIQLRLVTGRLIGQLEFPDRQITGLTRAPLSWIFTDIRQNEIVVLGPLGDELAIAPGVGVAGGMQAIAFDRITNHDEVAQVPLEAGVPGDPGTIHHPDTEWDPAPWLGRHRLYIANVYDQTIYAGYLTEA
jgi:hypothetical protein